METVFITIHDLSLDARIKYVSDSIEDILGYRPREVINRSCWEYFHPDEIPFARAIHGRGIQLDKAAVLNYCQIKHRDGYWVGCECTFTIVYDVLVAATSIYKRDARSQQRAAEAPVIRRIFSSSPRDPRYHMLQYLSNKFQQEPKPHIHEPRAALFLNRFTRTLTIMFATNGLADILGLSAEDLKGQSFYYCIAENCLQEAVRCLEGAKANDSIAYLRFWFRNPLQQEEPHNQDVQMEDLRSSDEDEDDGGVHINNQDEDMNDRAVFSDSSSAPSRSEGSANAHSNDHLQSANHGAENSHSNSSSGESTDSHPQGAIFDQPVLQPHSSTSSVHMLTPEEERQRRSPSRQQLLELEAVVSCSSDGLVVVLRRARPMIPHPLQRPAQLPYANGLFASPWAPTPIMPPVDSRPQYNNDHGFHPSLGPQIPDHRLTSTSQGPDSRDFMNSIRDVAVFAWSLTGINGSLSQYSRGRPIGEATPPAGMPIWDPKAGADPENHFNGYADNLHRRIPTVMDHVSAGENGTVQPDSVWRRATEMPPWQPIARHPSERSGSGPGYGSPQAENIEEDETAALRRMGWL